MFHFTSQRSDPPAGQHFVHHYSYGYCCSMLELERSYKPLCFLWKHNAECTVTINTGALLLCSNLRRVTQNNNHCYIRSANKILRAAIQATFGKSHQCQFFISILVAKKKEWRHFRGLTVLLALVVS